MVEWCEYDLGLTLLSKRSGKHVVGCDNDGSVFESVGVEGMPGGAVEDDRGMSTEALDGVDPLCDEDRR